MIETSNNILAWVDGRDVICPAHAEQRYGARLYRPERPHWVMPLRDHTAVVGMVCVECGKPLAPRVKLRVVQTALAGLCALLLACHPSGAQEPSQMGPFAAMPDPGAADESTIQHPAGSGSWARAVPCDTRVSLLGTIADYGEVEVRSMVGDQRPATLYVNPVTQTWSLIEWADPEYGCMIAAGGSWKEGL